MNDDKEAPSKPEAAPEELDNEALEEAAGGWGRTMYYSYSEGQSASYASRSSDSSKS